MTHVIIDVGIPFLHENSIVVKSFPKELGLN
jgi:hypothetical protein